MARGGERGAVLAKLCPGFILVLLLASPVNAQAAQKDSSTRHSTAASAAVPRPGQLVHPSLGAPKDSLQAVRIAERVLRGNSARGLFSVTVFTAVDGGYLIKLRPEPVTPGGGGLVWVESDGSVRILRRYR
jgi:hypothetical protein